MKTSTSVVVPFLFLSLLITSKGIRLPPDSLSATHVELQKGNSLINGEVIICRDEHCSGRSRKLMNSISSLSETVKEERAKVDDQGMPKKLSSNEFDSHRETFKVKSPLDTKSSSEKYPDIIDITGMDYSPAKRKPPIHN